MNPLALLVTYTIYGLIALSVGTFDCLKHRFCNLKG
ncbi:MAG: Unknown protein [uncultured Sulfurovum sp.]|uniref:Uncharacterized protein n=1 Tax=uncultured Sulfurovum sp. TaxID=269237 RepID=A0A6S6TPS5_9BACT|nr:MAG: Unknown protein [uncultured Sulfurovum sp.]